MNIRQRRTILILVILLSVGSAAGLALRGFQENVSFYRTPSQLQQQATDGMRYRVGGLVERGSVGRADDGVTLTFRVTDTHAALPVQYKGLVPDLFREGQGVVVEGRLQGGTMTADTVLARHDERYMPPEAAKALADAQDDTKLQDAELQK